MKSSIAFLVLLLAAASDARAGETARMPYRMLAEKIAEFEAVPAAERDRVELELRVRPETPPAEALKLWIVADGRRVDLPIDSTGRVALHSAAPLRDADAAVESNQPKGTLELEIALAPRLPDSARFRYADLQASAAQIDSLARRAAGIWGWLAPSTTRIVFTCADAAACSLSLHGRRGVEVRQPDGEGRISLPLTPELAAEDPGIRAAGTFARIAAAAD